MLKWTLGVFCWAYPSFLLGQAPPSERPSAPTTRDEPFAESILEAKSGSKVSGSVTFTHKGKTIEIVAKISGATPGKHGIHIHENGDCSALDASSAGNHFNPTEGKHAGHTATYRHVGDLGNMTIQKNGKGLLKRQINLIQGFPDWRSILGKSVVFHAKADDLKSQPSGNSGDRIACGTIQAAKADNGT